MFDLRAETRGAEAHESRRRNEEETTPQPEIKVQQPVMEYDGVHVQCMRSVCIPLQPLINNISQVFYNV